MTKCKYDTDWRDQLPMPDDNLVVWFASSTDYWHCWYNMLLGASAPRTADEVRELFWREYWGGADEAGYHPGVVHIAPEDDGLWWDDDYDDYQACEDDSLRGPLLR